MTAVLFNELSFAGGGTLPLDGIPGKTIRLRHAIHGVSELSGRQRRGEPPVIGCIAHDYVPLNRRTVLVREVDDLFGAIAHAVA